MKKLLFFLMLFFITDLIISQHKELPKWEKGFLDIHFISTGKGSAAFYILPDGTSMLIDVGDLSSIDDERRPPAMPDNSKSAPQWVADYIYQFHPDGKKAVLDYALITHYHDDHMGSPNNNSKTHIEGNYKLFGITELGSIIPIKKLIDRGYDYPVDFRNPKSEMNMGEMKGLRQFKEYWRFIEYQQEKNKLQYEKFRVGSINQFKLKAEQINNTKFTIKNLFANGDIANIYDTTVATRKFKDGEYPGENNLSCGIRITYGRFDLYTGGDINGIGHTGNADFFSMEAYAAPVIGQVDVATLNHHGNRDSQNEYFVRTIQPRVWIGQSWTARHPGEEVVRRITSTFVYPGERDLFTNFLLPATKTYFGKLVDDSYKSTSGHIVIRVYPDGNNYDLFILDDKTEKRHIIATYNYKSR
jgi:beta-lactamase superfamily II metal-dependent hydrolase